MVGSAVYSGHWLESAKTFVSRSRETLVKRPVWLFSSGPVGDPSRKPVQKMAGDPVEIAEIVELIRAREHRVLSGKLERKNLTFAQKTALLSFRGLEGDFRDWAEIDVWATQIAGALTAGS